MDGTTDDVSKNVSKKVYLLTRNTSAQHHQARIGYPFWGESNSAAARQSYYTFSPAVILG